MNKSDVMKTRTLILETLLARDPFPGWTWEAVAASAKNESTARAVFPEGLPDVLDSFSDFIDGKMFARLESVNPADLPVRERIRRAVLARFDALESCREAERAAALYAVLPFRKLGAACLPWRTAGRIWEWAGDTTTDYNHYTKRLLLSGVITSTLLAWLDEGQSRENIKAFLDRRIENVMQLNKIIAPFKGSNRRSVKGVTGEIEGTTSKRKSKARFKRLKKKA